MRYSQQLADCLIRFDCPDYLAGLGGQSVGRQDMAVGVGVALSWLAGKADEFRLARFYRAVSLLLAAGISLPRAMGMVTGLLICSSRRGWQN